MVRLRNRLSRLRKRRYVRERGTRWGVLIIVLMFGLFLEAYMHNFNLVYITLFFVFALGFTSEPVGIFNLRKLEATFDHHPRLFAQESGECLYRVTNRGRSTAWAVTLHCGTFHTAPFRVDGGESRLIALNVVPTRRGDFIEEACRLQSLFPLSTVRFFLPIDGGCRARVYPRPDGHPLQTLQTRQHSPLGEERDFEGITPSDGYASLSRIHWPSVAKGESAVKHFRREAQTQELIFDFLRCAPDDEARLSQLTLWVLECEQTQRDFRIQMPGRELDSRKESIDAILEHLALY